MMTGQVVHNRILQEAAQQKLEVPFDRTFVLIEGEKGGSGEVVHLVVKVLLPNKLLGFIKYPIFRKVETRFPAQNLPNGYTRYATDPGSEIARELASYKG